MKRKDYAVLGITILGAILFAAPIYLIVVNSFKTYGEIFSKPLEFPLHPTLENFKKA